MIWREFRVELLLLCIERGQLTWFGHLIAFQCLPVISFWRFFRHIQLRGGPGINPELTVEIKYLFWSWSPLGSLRGAAEYCWGEGCPGCLLDLSPPRSDLR